MKKTRSVCFNLAVIMTGIVPAIHAHVSRKQDMDARDVRAKTRFARV
ncbi:hypothetical protein [Bradyrhizobium sp.]|jgi:hypothetical protein